MYVGFRDLFKIGIGPSSSHTVGPMRAAARFVERLRATGSVERTQTVTVDLYSSLALTGRGHATDIAILLGLEGAQPSTLPPESIAGRVAAIRETGMLRLGGTHPLRFVESEHLRFRGNEALPFHPNAVRFTAVDAEGNELDSRVYFSIGGGFVHEQDDVAPDGSAVEPVGPVVPYPFRSAAELLEMAGGKQISIADLVRANEQAAVPHEPVSVAIEAVWKAMQECVARGMVTTGHLPGGLNVRRRAPAQAERLAGQTAPEALAALDWTSMWAMAANEENAAGGRVVTAPTNGAAGVIPAVLHYYMKFVPGASSAGVETFLLTATAIGALCKMNASISGAEVGCQGEVGVACAMAAGGLVAARGGSNAHVEQAAEIGIEHHLGMTCDPVGGLVQIPCIERNAVGAVKAIMAARIAMSEDGSHHVSLDQVIATMWETGRDMQSRYKETSLGGLALTLIEC